jgi:hypothetical protein
LAQDKEPADVKRMRKAWANLLPAEQEDVAAWFSADVKNLGTFQNKLLAFALTLEANDPAYLPEDPGIAWFDPKEHAPADPIPRRKLDADDSRAVAERKRLFASRAPQLAHTVWALRLGLSRSVVAQRGFPGSAARLRARARRPAAAVGPGDRVDRAPRSTAVRSRSRSARSGTRTPTARAGSFPVSRSTTPGARARRSRCPTSTTSASCT